MIVVAVAGAASASRSPVVALTFDDVRAGGTFATVADAGSGARNTRVRVVSDPEESVTSVASVPGHGTAGRFPAFGAGRAVVVVTNRSGTDVMNPGSRRLEFGADLTLDAEPTAASGSDNGNNAVQRGLYDDAAQFKLQVDARYPSCRVKGSGGAVEVTSSVPLEAGTTYRVRCARAAGADAVTISVAAFRDDGSLAAATSRTARAGTAIGTLAFAVTTPLAVGGKVWDDPVAGARLASAGDQWNGTVDNAVLRIG